MQLQDLTMQDIENVFWEAMAKGWVGGELKRTTPLMPGFKFIPFQSGRFSVLDAYCTTPLNDSSAGTTTIWFDDVPVWVMHYMGKYPKRVIPFLKLALQSTITSRDFIGGRGAKHFTHKDYPSLSYINSVASGMNSFSNFMGSECVCEGGWNIGHHNYRGMALI